MAQVKTLKTKCGVLDGREKEYIKLALHRGHFTFKGESMGYRMAGLSNNLLAECGWNFRGGEM